MFGSSKYNPLLNILFMLILLARCFTIFIDSNNRTSDVLTIFIDCNNRTSDVLTKHVNLVLVVESYTQCSTEMFGSSKYNPLLNILFMLILLARCFALSNVLRVSSDVLTIFIDCNNRTSDVLTKHVNLVLVVESPLSNMT
jgi:hypothetical protein